LFIDIPGGLRNEIYLPEYNSHAAFNHEGNQKVVFTGEEFWQKKHFKIKLDKKNQVSPGRQVMKFERKFAERGTGIEMFQFGRSDSKRTPPPTREASC
jgi:hypothetical protein